MTRPGTTIRAAAAALLLAAGGCGSEEPGVPAAEEPSAILQFDSTTVPPRVPQPIDLAIDPVTGRVDLSVAGTVVPDDCSEPGTMSVAQCEFDQYLESLDGYPTLGTATAPASAAISPDSLAGHVVVLDRTHDSVQDDVAVSFDPASTQIVVTPKAGWDVGTTYVVAIRGYSDGVRTAGGGRVVCAPATFLLKQQKSLTCGATAVEDVSADCGYVQTASALLPADLVPSLLVVLEGARQRLLELDAWNAAARAGIGMGDVAALWAFPTHTSPVAELDPSSGLVPRVIGPSELRVSFKGRLDPATVTAWSLGSKGTVFLLDLTSLQGTPPDLTGGIPAFQASVDGSDLVLKTDAPLTAGHQIGVLLTSGIASPEGKPLVASPVTVLLRATGALVDTSGRTNVSQIGDANAALLEAGRQQLAQLLDNELFAAMTGLARPTIAYVYAFEMPATPAGTR